jgi:hypothetical protein
MTIEIRKGGVEKVKFWRHVIGTEVKVDMFVRT